MFVRNDVWTIGARVVIHINPAAVSFFNDAFCENVVRTSSCHYASLFQEVQLVRKLSYLIQVVNNRKHADIAFACMLHKTEDQLLLSKIKARGRFIQQHITRK